MNGLVISTCALQKAYNFSFEVSSAFFKIFFSLRTIELQLVFLVMLVSILIICALELKLLVTFDRLQDDGEVWRSTIVS